MKQNIKLLFVFLLAFLIGLSPIVLGGFFPHPISGRVYMFGEPMAFFGITVTNIDSGESKAVDTNEFGDYLVDLGNFKKEYRNGDKIKIKACSNNPSCESIIEVEGGGEIVNVCVGSGSELDPCKGLDDMLVDREEGEPEIEILDEETTPGEMEELDEDYSWWKGFWGILIWIASALGIGLGGWFGAKKRFGTVLKKHREGQYKKK